MGAPYRRLSARTSVGGEVPRRRCVRIKVIEQRGARSALEVCERSAEHCPARDLVLLPGEALARLPEVRWNRIDRTEDGNFRHTPAPDHTTGAPSKVSVGKQPILKLVIGQYRGGDVEPGKERRRRTLSPQHPLRTLVMSRAPSRPAVSPNAGSVSEVSVGSFRQSRLATYVGPVLRAHIVVDLDRQPFAVQAVRSVASRT